MTAEKCTIIKTTKRPRVKFHHGVGRGELCDVDAATAQEQWNQT